MIRRVLNSVINVDLYVKNVANDFKTRLKQGRKDRLDVEMPITTSNDGTGPVVKSVVSGQLSVGYVIDQVKDQVKHGRDASIGGRYVF